jgi:hypothetical protein
MLNFNEIVEQVLNEAPIDTYQTIGDFSKSHSFTDKRDRELVTHPVAIKKVKDFFKNTNVDFDFYFVNLRGRKKFAEHGLMAKERVLQPYPEGLGITPEQLANGKINEDNITVFFVGNSAAEKIPLTSWTIAHRFGHAIRRLEAFEHYADWLEKKFNEVLKLYNIVKPSPYERNYTPFKFDKTKAKLFNQIGTMKSARDGKIDRYFEFYYELFAQYLKDGNVTFNPLKGNIVKGHAAYGRKEYAYTQNVEEVNNILHGITRDFSYYAEDILSSCVGNVYIM